MGSCLAGERSSNLDCGAGLKGSYTRVGTHVNLLDVNAENLLYRYEDRSLSEKLGSYLSERNACEAFPKPTHIFFRDC